ncbi:hypothetical protein Dimus_023361 [Dionaea muscipula]
MHNRWPLPAHAEGEVCGPLFAHAEGEPLLTHEEEHPQPLFGRAEGESPSPTRRKTRGSPLAHAKEAHGSPCTRRSSEAIGREEPSPARVRSSARRLRCQARRVGAAGRYLLCFKYATANGYPPLSTGRHHWGSTARFMSRRLQPLPPAA